MTIVIDASVALKWVLPEAHSEAAAKLQSEQLISPEFWLLEAANVLWRRHRRGEFTAEQANVRLRELVNAPVAPLPIEPYVGAALQLATAINHPVYDCLYLAVAVQSATYVVTADRRFAAAAQQPELDGRVRLLGS
jgi:predicted nucleic acid-binding protein